MIGRNFKIEYEVMPNYEDAVSHAKEVAMLLDVPVRVKPFGKEWKVLFPVECDNDGQGYIRGDYENEHEDENKFVWEWMQDLEDGNNRLRKEGWFYSDTD